MATMTSFFSRCLPEGAVVVRTPAEEVLLKGGNPSQVWAFLNQPLPQCRTVPSTGTSLTWSDY